MTNPVRDVYDRWAPTYDTMPNVTRDLDAELLRADLGSAELGDVLEIGCGTGKNTKWLVRRARVTGLDISAEMLARCRTAAPEATLCEADLSMRWPVEDAAFDTVLVDLVLEHVEDLGHIAREAARVLRPGGRLRVSELHPWRQHEGKAARFEESGVLVETPTFVHTTEAYVATFLNAGFVLDSLREARASGDRTTQLPRLLVLGLLWPQP